MSEPPLLEIRGLRKAFAGAQGNAIEPLDVTVRGGRITGLVGPDGAGKTTLLRLVAGLLQPDAGSIRVLGMDPLRDGPRVRGVLAYMPQKFGLYEDLTVMENLVLHADLRGITGDQRAREFGRLMGFTDLAAFTTRRAGALSGGMKQKLGLACALLGRPRLLLLDEPSAGVDPVSRRELWRMVSELAAQGIGVVWSTAYLDEAESCGEVILLSAARMLHNGPPGDLTARLSGRTWHVTGVQEGRRRLLAELLDRADVVDGVIQGAALRVVLRAGSDTSGVAAAAAALGGTLRLVKPRFEDAFIDLLGGARGGTSRLAESVAPKRHEGDCIVEARALTRRFGDFTATRDISFRIHPGEIFGLLGPNGAGKSTTFRMMCGLLKPTSGEALVAGISLSRAPGRARQRVGYMAQKFSLYGTLSARQNLDFFSGVYGLRGPDRRRQVDLMITLFGLEPYLGMRADTLPLGFKQRLALACAAMHAPDILFLDEPTSGVDPLTRREFWTHLNGLVRKGVTVMVTTHFMDEAEYCDRLGLVHRGELIALDRPQALKQAVAGPDNPEPTLEDAFIGLIRRRQLQQEAAR